jgi:hypothetical protein
MKLQQPMQNAIASEELNVAELKQKKRLGLQEIEEKRAQKRKLTLGQLVADKMAAK